MLTREQIQQNINALEQQGASQQEIQGWLDSLGSQKNQIQQNQTQPTTQDYMSQNQNNTIATYNPAVDAGANRSIIGSGLEAGGKAAINFIPSLLNAAGGAVNAAFNLPDTISGLTKIVAGGVEKLIPGEQGQEGNFNQAIDFFKKRYGSLDAITKTAVEDPFGYATDILTVLTAGSGVASKLGLVNKLSEASKVSKASELVKATSKGTQNFLQKSIMDISDANKIKFGEKINQASDYITSRNIFGTPNRQLNIVNKDIVKFENTLQPVIKQASIDGIRIPNSTIINDLKELKSVVMGDTPTYALKDTPIERAAKSIRNEPDTQLYLNRIDKEIKSLERTPEVDPFDAYQRKRSYAAGKVKEGGFVPADYAEKAISDIYYKNVSDTLKSNGLSIEGLSLEDFNKRYSQALNARDVLELSRLRPGLLSKIIGIGGGTVLGNTIYPGVGGFGGALAGTFNPTVQKTVQTGLNIAKSGASKVIGIGSKELPKAVLPSMAGFTSSNRVDEYLKSLGF